MEGLPWLLAALVCLSACFLVWLQGREVRGVARWAEQRSRVRADAAEAILRRLLAADEGFGDHSEAMAEARRHLERR